jgi:serine/threonine protein kinase
VISRSSCIREVRNLPRTLRSFRHRGCFTHAAGADRLVVRDGTRFAHPCRDREVAPDDCCRVPKNRHMHMTVAPTQDAPSLVQTERSDRLRPGSRIGPYEIVEFLGAGGMGEVYRAHDLNLDRIVALKLLPLEVADNPDRVHRFEEEARAASALSHPSIVTIYDAGKIGSRAFISMELVPGETLREILRPGLMPLRKTLHIAAQVSEGLAIAHEARLVHRDLKPENIKVSRDGAAKILDFGLAKRIPSAHGGLAAVVTALETAPGMVLGTAGYMSPEQAAGERVDFPSDQFSLGVILYEMLTGRRAFDRTTMAETLTAIIRDEPEPIIEVTPSVPPPLRWIVERCLAKDPVDRYAITRDLARDLIDARDHIGEMLVSRRSRTIKRTAGESSLAVLPVLDMSVAPQPETLADTMTDAFITALSQCKGLSVISRVSSLTYKGRHRALPDVADELGVDWLLVASIAKSGRELRVNAQLVDANSDENRWAHSFNGDARRLLSVETDIAAEVAKHVEQAIRKR